jgi:hypothetical protein
VDPDPHDPCGGHAAMNETTGFTVLFSKEICTSQLTINVRFYSVLIKRNVAATMPQDIQSSKNRRSAV